MRKWIASMVLIAFCFVSFAGCAGTNKGPDANYQLYVEAMRIQAAQKQEPLMKMELWDDGSVKSLAVAVPRDPIMVQQRKTTPHPGWGVLNSLIRVGGIVGGIWAAGDALEGLVQASTGTTTNIGSGNSAGGDLSATTTLANSYNSVGGTSSLNGTGIFDSQKENVESPTTATGASSNSASDSHDSTTTTTDNTNNSQQ